MYQQENIPQSKKFRNQKLPKQYKINVQLVSQTSFDKEMSEKLTQDQKLQAVLQLKSIHLQWLNIRKIQNLQVFTNLNVLYLQNNKISKIENLECLVNLQYLALNDNMISHVQNLNHLKKLIGLNLGNNEIEQIGSNQLPKSIQMLSLKGNPIALDTNYRVDIIKALPSLDMLDADTIHPQEKLKIIGKFPQKLLQYSQKLKHFRNKKQISKQLQEQNQPVYLGATFQQKQAVKQMRQKTRKYMHIAKEGFETGMQDQNENFQQKIKISRKIRDFKESQIKKNQELSQINQTNDQQN